LTPYANVKIKDGQVYSSKYDDIYYSRDNGPAESEFVFLTGNDLPARWQERSGFCITEAGFGTGLNFLVTIKAWLDDPTRSKTLDYFAIEAYPLSIDQLTEVHTHWPEFKTHSAALLEQYPNVTRGCHTLVFADGRVQLHLIFEKLETALNTYNFDPDSWFLDGFAPSKNPSMWRKEVLLKIAAHSCPGTSLATFTAAGQVRRDLTEAGFEVSKCKGFGRKREMLRAIKSGPKAAQNLIKHEPWFALQSFAVQPRKIAVIGAGIAGAQIAWHLAQRGVSVLVIDALEEVARGASGNQAGILAPKLTSSASREEAFYLAAFLYQLRQLDAMKQKGHDIPFTQHGLLQLAHDPATQRHFEQLAMRDDLPRNLLEIVSPDYASEHLGEPIEQSCLLINLAGSLAPGNLCKTLLAHPNIELRLSTSLEKVSRCKQGSTLKLSSGESLSVDALVLANGYQLAQFSDSIKITPVRGQTSSAQLTDNKPLGHMLKHDGYLLSTPRNGSAKHNKRRLIFGASYQRGNVKVDLRSAETQQNLDSLTANLPNLASHLTNIKPSHAGVRASTPDRWPIVGPLANSDFYQKEYADLHQGKQYKKYPAARYQEGVFALSGLGSRGLTSAAYCANLLAHMILGSAPPAPINTVHALHPARFIIRNLRKGKNKFG
jgi:tRNA 5-methylaminomethyl-2-thiouridine biosynthesis bifunctional protein